MPERFVSQIATDWFAPWARVTLKNGSDEFPMWVGTESLDKSAHKYGYTGRNLALVNEVTIEWQGLYYAATIRLAPNYDDALRILNSSLIIQGVTNVLIEIGFATTHRASGAGRTYQVFEGRITGVEFATGTEITFTLKSVPAAIPTLQETTGRSRAKMTVEEHIKRLWRPGPTRVLEFVGTGRPEYKAYSNVPIEQAQGGKSVMSFLDRVVKDIGCTAIISERTKNGVRQKVLQIVPRSETVERGSVATFVLFSPQEIGGATQLFPILSCNADTSTLYARAAKGVHAYLVDEANMKVEEVKRGAEGDPNQEQANPKVLAPRATGKQAGRGPKPDADTPDDPEVGEARQVMFRPGSKDRQLYEKISVMSEALGCYSNQGIKMEVESVLMPFLEPNSLVEVEGLGRQLDGTYLVHKVTLVVGQDGGLTRWEGTGMGSLKDDTQQKSAGVVLQSKPPVVQNPRDDSSAAGSVEVEPVSGT